ncbi:hypothetical protein KY334_00280 [Candidatus Woesearchaeota archaeon]|nr:hypothetical protein [Candidatus Woesearchaeota archaeon]
MIKKIIAYSLIIIAILNIFLFVTKRIDSLFFWLIIILIAIYAYKIQPKLNI